MHSTPPVLKVFFVSTGCANTWCLANLSRSPKYSKQYKHCTFKSVVSLACPLTWFIKVIFVENVSSHQRHFIIFLIEYCVILRWTNVKKMLKNYLDFEINWCRTVICQFLIMNTIIVLFQIDSRFLFFNRSFNNFRCSFYIFFRFFFDHLFGWRNIFRCWKFN